PDRSAVRTGTKAVLDPLDNAVKDVALIRSIDHRETVNAAAPATEHRFFIEDLPVSFARQGKPTAAEAVVVNPIVSVGIARDIVLVARRRKVCLVAERTDEQARLAIFGNEQLSIASFGRTLHGKDIAWILETETVARVAISVPIARPGASRRQH